MSLGQTTAVTDPGRKRRRNEDAYVCEPPLFAVADGMGGAQAGEIASRLAAAALRGTEASSASEDDVAALIQEANRRVYEAQSEDEAVSGMGTTLTVALAGHDRVAIGHVGDSRAYLIRDGRLEQLTEDHSLVAELVRSGRLSPEEAEIHPQRSVITRALGTEAEVDVDSFTVPARTGDLFMVCSDGLTSMVDDGTILSIVEEKRDDLKAAAKSLVDAANRGGGEDNITIVLFEIADALEDTMALPAEEEEPGTAGFDEEDTLSEADRVPVVESVPAVSQGQAPGRVRKRRRRSWRPALVTVLLLIVLGTAAGLFGLSKSHFVGVQKNGRVAVYQGVPWNLVDGVRLYRMVYESPLLAVQLSQPERRELFDHDLESYGKALAKVRRYEADLPVAP
jgi:protein phosphatase